MRRLAMWFFAALVAVSASGALAQAPTIPTGPNFPTVSSAPIPVTAPPIARPAPTAPPAVIQRLPRAVYRHSLRLCNHTSEQIWLAIAYQSGSQTISKGWWKVSPDGCSATFGPEYGMQYYAYSPSGRRWGGSEPHCVATTAFEIRSPSSDDTCRSGQSIRAFIMVDNSQGEAYSTNLVER
jgi:uncharacterized membrane protein